MHNEFSIMNYDLKTPEAIKEKVRYLGQHLMTPSSHGIEKFGEVPIVDAAKRQTSEFLKDREGPNGANPPNAALDVMTVVLAANRKYNTHVKPRIDEIKRHCPQITLQDVKDTIAAHNFKEFKRLWGHADKKKYQTLRSIVNALLQMDFGQNVSDFDRLRMWSSTACLASRKEDRIGCIPNVGVATFQHLRIIAGTDTVKPDTHVMKVLEREFGARLTQVQAIHAVEQIANITGMRVLEIDQIFVKYGSGYYTSHGGPSSVISAGIQQTSGHCDAMAT